MANDMVFDRNMNPAYINTPEQTKKWLRYRMSSDPLAFRGYTVRLGNSMKIVPVSQYLGHDRSDE